MAIRFECKDYGFECEFSIEGRGGSFIAQLRTHFADKHGIDYTSDAVIQTLVNKGHTRESVMND